jgi:hypothetical protein
VNAFLLCKSSFVRCSRLLLIWKFSLSFYFYLQEFFSVYILMFFPQSLAYLLIFLIFFSDEQKFKILRLWARTRCWWFTFVILATQEAKIRRITVRSQSRQIAREFLSLKNLSQKRAGGVAQGVGPEFKP